MAAATTDLDKKIAELETQLELLTQARTILHGGAIVVRPAAIAGPYTGMSLIDAIRDVVGRKGQISAPEIAHAVRDGGITSTSKNLAATVHQAMRQNPDFKKVDGQWQLVYKGQR